MTKEEALARIRSVKPDLLEDGMAAQLSDAAFRLLVSSWILADDHGCLRAHDAYLSANVWQDTTRDVETPRAELVRTGWWRTYEVDGQPYAENLWWRRDQRIDNAGARRVPGPPQMSFPILTEDFSEVRREPRNLAAGNGDGRGGGRDMEMEGDMDAAADAAPVIQPSGSKAKKTVKRGLRLMPKDWKPKDSERQKCLALGIDVDMLAGEFVDYWLGRGEMRADWDACFRNNIRNVTSNPKLVEKFALSVSHQAKPKPQKVHGPPAPMPQALKDRIRHATGGVASGALKLLQGGEPEKESDG